MAPENVKLLVPFESLIDSIAKLTIREKLRLWRLLDEQLAQVEEEAWEKDPVVQSEIREAHSAYQTGDYVTLDEYIAGRRTRKR